jgi:hypothetical protein
MERDILLRELCTRAVWALAMDCQLDGPYPGIVSQGSSMPGGCFPYSVHATCMLTLVAAGTVWKFAACLSAAIISNLKQ